MCGGRVVSLFTHKKPHAFTENQAKIMKKTAAHGGYGEVRGGQLKGTTLNHSLIVFPLIWVHLIDPWPEFCVNGLAPYFL